MVLGRLHGCHSCNALLTPMLPRFLQHSCYIGSQGMTFMYPCGAKAPFLPCARCPLRRSRYGPCTGMTRLER